MIFHFKSMQSSGKSVSLMVGPNFVADFSRGVEGWYDSEFSDGFKNALNQSVKQRSFRVYK